jgi:hypothetical protein
LTFFNGPQHASLVRLFQLRYLFFEGLLEHATMDVVDDGALTEKLFHLGNYFFRRDIVIGLLNATLNFFKLI